MAAREGQWFREMIIEVNVDRSNKTPDKLFGGSAYLSIHFTFVNDIYWGKLSQIQ